MEELLEVEFRPDTSEGPQLHFDIPLSASTVEIGGPVPNAGGVF